MAFRGLFIGIDRYSSRQISWLNCAKRDAVALDALFFDTLGGTTSLLVDDEATHSRIREELASLTTCDPDDTVVIAFSGHGTDTHQLVVYDTDVHDLAHTTIPLSELIDWFSRIPAERLVLLLDCCFSGGLGSKVLKSEAVPRSLASVDAELAQLSGEGRIVFTASAADEEAWENSKTGHGYFTQFLIEALLGPEDMVENGRFSVYRLLEFITRHVTDVVQRFGHLQHPTLRGTIDGELSWPVFVRGQRYLDAFPEFSGAKADASLDSLMSFGFPAPLIECWSRTIPSLNQLQIDAINDFGILTGDHLVVAAPTSSGKTMVGELAALKAIMARKRAIFLFPLKALVADKRRSFEATYGSYGLRIFEATGETDDAGPLLRGQYDIALLTYEKFAALVLTYPHVLKQAGVIVVDEIQMLADENRGANLEFLLTLLIMKRREGIEPQIIALSGVVGAMNGLERWLGGRLLRRDERPVPLDEGVLLPTAAFRFIEGVSRGEKTTEALFRPHFVKGSSQDLIIPLLQKLVAEGNQIIVFRETKGETRGCARYLAKALGLPAATDALARLPGGDASSASRDLLDVLSQGVSFHNADLKPEERLVIEEEFRKPNASVRVIVATTTLAMGVNTPASAVVIAGLDHPGDKPYSVAEYKNLVGRAGRLGYSEHGVSYLIAMDRHQEHDFWTRYVTASPEDLHSRFLDQSTDPRSLVVKVLAAGGRISGSMTATQIVAFLESSFGVFQEAARQDSWKWNSDQLRSAISNLERHQLIRAREDGSYELTSLGRLAGESAIEVESIVRVVACTVAVGTGDLSDPTLIAIAQVTRELDDLYFPLNKKSTIKEPQEWFGQLRHQGVPQQILNQLGQNVTDSHVRTLRAKKAIASLLYVSGQEMGAIENTLTRFGGANDGAAGPIRSIASRTSDVLPTVARVAELLHPDLAFGDRVGRLVVRLTFGIDGSAVELARVTGSSLQRGDYLRLSAAGLCSSDAIRKASDDQILACVDGSTVRLAFVREAAGEMDRLREDPAPVIAIEPYRA